jgi:hypothetical protein
MSSRVSVYTYKLLHLYRYKNCSVGRSLFFLQQLCQQGHTEGNIAMRNSFTIHFLNKLQSMLPFYFYMH